MSTQGSQGFHNYERPVRSGDDEEEDPLETMLNKTGCKELHYSLQDCMAEHRDWRQCKDLVQQFKECMIIYEKNKSQNMSK
ncbi:unnamed protein product [Medioppia subpectinata]|uniref:Uncharacterized protein n=1 Tax=Medioppia subpectinata TaxID=1979941 RepID=A0A7R9LW70_9ACAR|nr:unnamed protein product [Medioppia subpectinata]CAG2122284.1 unnamed protein product [Medioppia subpectinata]